MSGCRSSWLVACPGVKGVFFTDSSEDTLVKGIEAIFRGEYWLPRRLLCAHLERTRTVQGGFARGDASSRGRKWDPAAALRPAAAPSTSPTS